MTLNILFKIKIMVDYQIIWKKTTIYTFCVFLSVLAPVETAPNNVTRKQTIPAILGSKRKPKYK